MTPTPLRSAVLAAALLLAATVVDAATVVRGPYLQQPTSASMILRWRTDVATNSRVRYGASPGSLSQTVDIARSLWLVTYCRRKSWLTKA